MLRATLLLGFVVFKANGSYRDPKIVPPSRAGGPGPWEPLFLTPYLKSGNIGKAQELAKVTALSAVAKGILSYSGFLTVNSTYDSHLFFWFFPAARKPETAPLLLWLNGGPGTPSLIGVFVEHGPFYVDKDLNLRLREVSWTQAHSVLYVGSPVGSGFSYTGSEEGYSKTNAEVGRDLYAALRQFFTLFPDYRARDFYATGQGFAGKSVPAIAVQIHEANQKGNGKSRINLKGIAIGNGYTDPASSLFYGDYLFKIGLIDKAQREYFTAQENKAKKLIGLQQFSKAYDIVDQLFLGEQTPHRPTQYQLATGFKNAYNFLLSDPPAKWSYYATYTRLPQTRRALHVGNIGFITENSTALLAMKGDILDTAGPLVQTLLDAPEGYKVLFYSGNLDIVFPTPSTDSMLNRLIWNGANGYKKAPRKIWRVGGEAGYVGGYWKTYRNLNFVTILDAGRHVPADQPERAAEMISRFTAGKAVF